MAIQKDPEYAIATWEPDYTKGVMSWVIKEGQEFHTPDGVLLKAKRLAKEERHEIQVIKGSKLWAIVQPDGEIKFQEPPPAARKRRSA